MICHRCLQRAALSTRSAPFRFFSRTSRSSSTPVTSQTTTATNPRPDSHPAATSTSAAQPFSTPNTPSPSNDDSVPSPATGGAPRSSVAAGTVLRGLNFLKNAQDPIAMEDHEYPDWLWTVLDQKTDGTGLGGAGEDDGDLFAKSKKQRQKAAKAMRKRQAMDPEMMAPKVPLHEQTVDLEGGSRELEDLTKSMRQERRRKIKEDNFLRAMR